MNLSACRRWLAILSAGLVASCLLTDSARAQQIIAKPVVQSPWSWFGADFEPEWTGDTKRIDYRPGNHGSTVINVGGLNPYNPPPAPAPIGLVSAARSQSLFTTASVLSVTAESKFNYSIPGKGTSTDKDARYAQVINFQDVLLNQATAVAEMTATIRDDSLAAKGRLSAGTYFPEGVLAAGDGSAAASMSARVFAEYKVTSPLPFSLKGVLSNGGGLDLSFRLTKDSSTNELYSVVTTAGKSSAFDLSGTLTPGNYTLVLNGKVDTAGTRNWGGLGEYSLEFSASAPLTADFDGDGRVGAADLGAWRSTFEPNAGNLTTQSDRRDGTDFLAWQRQLGWGAASEVVSAAVPEPNAFALAALAMLGCVRRGRRS